MKTLGKSFHSLILCVSVSLLPACAVTHHEVVMDSSSPNMEVIRPSPLEQDDIALCLSGGGYRATLYHAGVVAELNSLGLLPRIRQITGVSGGAIAAAWLGVVWNDLRFVDGTAANLDEAFIQPLLKLTSHTIDVSGLVDTLSPLGSNRLDASLDRFLFEWKSLSDLPTSAPTITITATELSSGAPWIFEKQRAGSAKFGYLHDPKLKLSVAVAASAALPVVFRPVALSFDRNNLYLPPLSTDEARERLAEAVDFQRKARGIAVPNEAPPSDEKANKYAQLLVEAQRANFTKQIGDFVYLIDGGVTDNFGERACKTKGINILSTATTDDLLTFRPMPTSLASEVAQSIDLMHARAETLTYMRVLEAHTKAMLGRPCQPHLASCVQGTTFLVSFMATTSVHALAQAKEEVIPTRLKAMSPEQQSRLLRWGQARAKDAIEQISTSDSESTQ